MTGWSATRDPGRQPERTRLAWRRTTLAVTVVALLAVRLALLGPTPTLRLLGTAAVLISWLAFLALSWYRITGMSPARPAAPGRVVPLTTLAVLGYAALGVALVALG